MHRLTGWIVFIITALVYFFSAERTGSLWDCGEFIAGAYKLQVVHPPGAPFFILVGRIFTWFAELLSDNPENIAFSVNIMSGICSAFAASFICWTTILLGRFAILRDRSYDTDNAQNIALAGGGLVAGLATAFATSIWFSAVEGEVYAMSTFFTALTFWSTIKWYTLPDEPSSDRWLLFTIYAAGLSIGVHLLSLLTFPALALFYYFKKYERTNWKGMLVAAGIGVLFIVFVQQFIIVGIPRLWSALELLMVNQFGAPVHTGLIPVSLIIGAVLFFGLRYAHRRNNALIQQFMVAVFLLVASYTTFGIVVIRANAAPPINMNAPSDAMRLLPYLNREQYGERDLLYGPAFDAKPISTDISDRYGLVGDKYEITDYKIDVEYNDRDKMLFPRMSDGTLGRPRLYKQWMGLNPDEALPRGRPSYWDNFRFFVDYQLGWMYWRYFMWNFAGRQNGEQGFFPADKSAGHWISGIKFLDEWRLGNLDELPETDKVNEARNTYFLLPFIFGLLGMFWHYGRRKNEFLGLLALFIITGIGIIVYTNQPPNEPRERDYVLVGSFFTFCIWMGMAVPAIFALLRDRLKTSGIVAASVAAVLVLIAPTLMGFQNYDDNSRLHHEGARDYASNFLNSVDENAIIFTYGDNDTYPLWYAQEVENIRTDVRVVNLSLIAVDWYIDLLRRKVNDSPAIKLSIPQEQIRGRKRNQIIYNPSRGNNPPMNLQQFLQFIGEDHPVPLRGGGSFESYYPTTNVFIPVDRQRAIEAGLAEPGDTNIVDRIPVRINDRQLTKDDIAVLDLIASNFYDRPIYFAVTSRPDKLYGMDDYFDLEGLALRLTATKGQSDPSYGIIGSGEVNAEKLYDRALNQWRWGNFDQYDTFVDTNFGPSIQAMQLSMRRAAFKLLQTGETEKALALIDQYFEAFPHMNFPYDYRTVYMLAVYWEADAFDKAKPHMELLARETADKLAYFESIDARILQASFQSEYQFAFSTANSLLQEARRSGDEDLIAYVQEQVGPYVELPPEMPEIPEPLQD